MGCCARDGQPPTPFKKEEKEGVAEGVRNWSLVKIIFRPII
jgi:hypothetical protein